MSTDDRDIESSNPSKNFKVGDFDQRSGFFTPVWESKRRIRSEPPSAAPSSKSASSRGEGSVASSPAAEAGDAAAGEGPTTGKGSRQRSGSGNKAKRARAARNETPVPPSASEGLPAVLLPPAVAAVFDPAVELDREESSSVQLEASAPVEQAPAEVSASSPEPGVEQGPAASEAPARPSAAARALRDAGPDLPPAAFLDAVPEFRAPREAATRNATERSHLAQEERTDRSPVHQRSLRATNAAARVHDQLKAKLQAEAAELDESRFDLTPDSQLPPLQEQENDPYPQSLMRRLRRTIRLSTPVPDPIRSLISKYDRG